MLVKIGLPAQLVHTETGKTLRNFKPYEQFNFAVFNKNTGEGVTMSDYDRLPRKVVYGKLGAKFGGLVT